MRPKKEVEPRILVEVVVKNLIMIKILNKSPDQIQIEVKAGQNNKSPDKTQIEVKARQTINGVKTALNVAKVI